MRNEFVTKLQFFPSIVENCSDIWLLCKKCKVQKQKKNKFIRHRMFQRIAHTHLFTRRRNTVRRWNVIKCFLSHLRPWSVSYSLCESTAIQWNSIFKNKPERGIFWHFQRRINERGWRWIAVQRIAYLWGKSYTSHITYTRK